MKVNQDNTEEVICKVCGCPFFVQALRVRRVSQFISPTGNDEFASKPTLICSACCTEVGKTDSPIMDDDETENTSCTGNCKGRIIQGDFRKKEKE